MASSIYDGMASDPLSQFCRKCGAILPIADHGDKDTSRCQICRHEASELDRSHFFASNFAFRARVHTLKAL